MVRTTQEQVWQRRADKVWRVAMYVLIGSAIVMIVRALAGGVL
jgi:hypothetical protein